MSGPGQFRASGFFVLRTPLLPFGQLTSSRLWDRMAAPDLREALYLASPRLEESLTATVPDRRLEPVLLSYLSRAAARPTPFGLFAGCTTGGVAGHTDLELAEPGRWQRHSRLDMDYLWALAGAVETDGELRRHLRFFPNSSITDAGDRLHVCVPVGGSTRAYHLLAVTKSPYLLDTLARAASGATLADLASGLVDADPGIDDASAEGFVSDLADAGLLVSSARPAVTDGGALDQAVIALEDAPATKDIAEGLRRAGAVLAEMDAAGLGGDPGRYRAVAGHLGALPAPVDPARLVQVDLVTAAAGALTLNRRVVAEIEAGVRLLHQTSTSPAQADLDEFRRRFEERYGSREVPLAEALDEETAIGFGGGPAGGTGGVSAPAPLLAGLGPATPAAAEPESFTGRDRWLLGRLVDALRADATEISIDAAALGPSDVGPAAASPAPLPDAFAALVSVAAESAGAIDGGRFRVLIHEVTGPSGALLLGRFCSADPALEAAVRDHLKAEEELLPDRIFAEIVHLPEGRIGNVLCRPVLRAWEIPYLGRSGLPPDRQLPLSDLLVAVRDERIVLRSGRLGREVVPRLTTAHNYGAGTLPVYRFLCRLQDQNVTSSLSWDWGALAHEPYLPRVISGRVVLARARWNLDRREIRRLAPGGGQEGVAAAVRAWKAQRRIDRYVALADDDEELVLDLDDSLGAETLAHHLRGRDAAVLLEVFPGPDELCVTGEGGRFVHQMVVPFVRSETIHPTPALAARPGFGDEAEPARRRPPGSDWLYAKLYCGPLTADRLLAGPLAALVRTYVGSGAAEDWFFLRYADPDDHLRLRFRGRPERLLTEVLPALHGLVEPLLERGPVWRLALDTYDRETERYGGPAGIELAERIFRADSDAALTIVAGYPGDSGADLRWRLALAGIDRLFDDLGMTLAEKRALARSTRDRFRHEHGDDARMGAAVAGRFRAERSHLETLIAADGDGGAASGPLAPGLAALTRRSSDVAAQAAELRARARAGRLSTTLADMAGSLAHLHVNRLLPTAQRAQELILYEFLDRLYTGRAAREATA